MTELDLTTLTFPDLSVVPLGGRPPSARWEIRTDAGHGLLALSRCRNGRLREAYPVGEHDIEIVLTGSVPAGNRTTIFMSIVRAIKAADPFCRRIVVATDALDYETLRATQDAGFRYVLDVDLREGAFSLAIAEPAWVTAVDMDLDHVPET